MLGLILFPLIGTQIRRRCPPLWWPI